MKFELIPKVQAEKLRESFIAKFVDTKSEYYLHYYDKNEYGFLWESIRGGETCTQERAAEYLARFDRVYFMWDWWRKGTVFADEYPNAVIEVIENGGGDLGRLAVDEWNAEIEAEKHDCYIEHPRLPSDIYVFDDSFSWCVIFTHESNDCDSLDDLVRFCIIYN